MIYRTPVRRLQRELSSYEFRELDAFDRHWTLDPNGWDQAATIIQHMYGLMMSKGELLPPKSRFKPCTPPPCED